MKKILAMLLVVVMTLSLVACGGNTADPTTATGDTEASNATTEPAVAEEVISASQLLNGKEYGVDYVALYEQLGADVTIDQVVEDTATGLAYITVDGTEYELGLDFLTMAMVYNVDVPEGGEWATADDVYATWWKLYMQRWNYLMPEIPLYSNIYITLYPEWLENYEQDSFWDFSQAILYATIAE